MRQTRKLDKSKVRPLLVLVSGPPGAGKSTLAHGLAPILKACVLDKDCIDECFSPGDRGPKYTRTIEPAVLQALLNLAELNLSLGISVILDVPWTHILLNTPSWVRRIRALAKTTGSRFRVLEIRVSEKELYRRLRTRGLDRDQVKLTPKGWKKFLRADRVGARNPFPHILIDATWTRERAHRFALKNV